MKRIYLKRFAVLSVFLIVFCSVMPVFAMNSIGYILVTPYDAYNLINNEDIIIIDVRSLDQFQSCHLDNAISIPLSTFSQENPVFTRYNHNQPILLYCNVGMTSKIGASLLVEWGYNEVYSLEGGLQGWLYSGEGYINKTESCITLNDLMDNVSYLEGANLYKQRAKTLANSDVKTLIKFLRSQGFKQLHKDTSAIELIFNGIEFTAVEIPFVQDNKESIPSSARLTHITTPVKEIIGVGIYNKIDDQIIVEVYEVIDGTIVQTAVIDDVCFTCQGDKSIMSDSYDTCLSVCEYIYAGGCGLSGYFICNAACFMFAGPTCLGICAVVWALICLYGSNLNCPQLCSSYL